MINQWTFSGKVFYLKLLDKDFGASVKLRGEAARKDVSFKTEIAEMACLMTKECYEEAKSKGMKLLRNITVSGHLETFVNKGKTKTMFIAEEIINVG